MQPTVVVLGTLRFPPAARNCGLLERRFIAYDVGSSCDTFLAGCLSYFVENGTLDPQRTDAVASVCADLERVMPRLSGEAHEYFTELLVLGKALEVRANAR